MNRYRSDKGSASSPRPPQPVPKASQPNSRVASATPNAAAPLARQSQGPSAPGGDSEPLMPFVSKFMPTAHYPTEQVDYEEEEEEQQWDDDYEDGDGEEWDAEREQQLQRELAVTPAFAVIDATGYSPPIRSKFASNDAPFLSKTIICKSIS